MAVLLKENDINKVKCRFQKLHDFIYRALFADGVHLIPEDKEYDYDFMVDQDKIGNAPSHYKAYWCKKNKKQNIDEIGFFFSYMIDNECILPELKKEIYKKTKYKPQENDFNKFSIYGSISDMSGITKSNMGIGSESLDFFIDFILHPEGDLFFKYYMCKPTVLYFIKGDR